MAVLEDLKRDFQFETRTRGKQYYLDDAVHIANAEPGAIKAHVTGGEKYRVEIRWEPMGMAYACTCPYFQDNDLPCKHLWATLLEADHQGVLEAAARRIDISGSSSGANGHRHSNGGGAFGPSAVADPTSSLVLAPSKRRSLWQSQLEKIRDSVQRNARVAPPMLESAWPDDRRILYAIDVERSARSLGGGAVVRLFTQKFTKAGKWGEPKRFGFTVQQWLGIGEAEDREIAQMLVGSARGFFMGPNDPTIELAEWAHDTVLKKAVQTGRCHLCRGDNLIGDAIAWDDGPAYRFQIEVLPCERSNGHRLVATVARGSGESAESIPLAETSALVAHGWVIFADRIAKLDHFDAWALLGELRAQEEMVIPSNDTEELLRELFMLPKLPALKLPDALGIKTVDDLPLPALRVISPTKTGAAVQQGTLQVEATYDYGGQKVSADDARVTLFDPASRTLVRRDREEEARRWKQLAAAGVRWDNLWGRDQAAMVLSADRLANTVIDLISLGWNVEADGKAYRTAGNIDVAVSSGIDWFDLDVNVDFGGGAKASLPKLLKAMSKGQKSVQLDDGTIGLLPEDWLSKYAVLAGLGEEQAGGTLRFGKVQVGFLDAMIATLPQATFDESYARARAELSSFGGVGSSEPVESFLGNLREYQKEGLGWLNFLRQFNFGGCLADDMGLGKTVQVLALLEGRRVEGRGTSLVVVPRSLVFNWQAEAKRFAPALKVHDYSGVARDKNVDAFKNFDIILTTYGTLRRDIAMLREFHFDYLILDESQAIKNAATASAKSVRLLRGNHRLAMSGTPIENHLGELWSLFEFLNPGMLGGASVFRTISGGQGATPEGRQLVAKAVRPFVLRRTKTQVAKELPDRVEQTIFCELDEVQRKLYDDLRDHYRVALLNRVDEVGLGQSKIQVLEALLRLRQAACHPALLDHTSTDAPSAKLDALLEHLTAIHDEGHKALVFSQFTSFLALARAQLDARGIRYEYLDGQTNDRQAPVERFQNDPDSRLFLISLKAGGVGLNLTAAEYVFLLDPWWNPAVEAQAIDRAHRIGQKNTVFAYRLIAKDTVEEKVLQLQSSKRELADAIINQDNSVIGSLTADDLKLLLS